MPSDHAVLPQVPPESGRAPRMSPQRRREMLVAATLPLLTRHGLKVTTKQIAESAGVAEGTIFRVFPDKDALVRAAVAKALDHGPLLAELAAVDQELALRERLVAVTTILQRRFVMVFDLLLAVGRHTPPDEVDEHRRAARRQHAAIAAAVAATLEPDQPKLRCPVAEVVRILRLLTFAGSHPLISDGRLLAAEEIADVVLHGMLRHDGADPAGDGHGDGHDGHSEGDTAC